MCTPTTGPSFWRTSLTNRPGLQDWRLAVAGEVVFLGLDLVVAELLLGAPSVKPTEAISGSQ